MEAAIIDLTEIVSEYSKKITAIPEAEFSKKILPNKWSKKEVLGHLIDSAQNNLRRFICSQYESMPPKITYQQDFWVKANDYQNQKSADVIALWVLMNQQIAAVLKTMPPGHYGNSSDTGREEVRLHTLKWLAHDYVKHMKHHMNQILPGSFDIVYT
jgi:DinB superfamily